MTPDNQERVRFWETVGLNNGMTVRTFLGRDEALAWLAEGLEQLGPRHRRRLRPLRDGLIDGDDDEDAHPAHVAARGDAQEHAEHREGGRDLLDWHVLVASILLEDRFKRLDIGMRDAGRD